MNSKDAYREQFKKEMIAIIERLEMPELQKEFMKSRWLDQVLWLEKRATTFRDRFYKLRLSTIIGGVVVPALVSLNISGTAAEALRWTTFGISQLVAISAAVEEFIRYGDRSHQYRNTAEGLKIEGWQFFQLSGPYRNSKNHADAYVSFATRVEFIIKKDVAVYIADVSEKKDKHEEKEEKDKKEEKDGQISDIINLPSVKN